MVNLGALLAAVGQGSQPSQANILGRVLSGQGASTGGIVPPGRIRPPRPNPVVGPPQPTVSAPRINPSTGVPQAPQGAGFLEKLKFNFQNDPALAKALQVGGLRLLGGGSKSFARNVSNAGIAGLETLEQQRGLQRQNVQQQKNNTIANRTVAAQEGSVKAQREATKSRERVAAGDRAVQAATATARTRVLNRQADADFRRAAAAEAAAQQKPPQLTLIDIIAKDLVAKKAINPNTKKPFTSPEEALAEAVRISSSPQKAAFIQAQLKEAEDRIPGGAALPDERRRQIIADASAFYDNNIAAKLSVPGLSLPLLEGVGLGHLVNGTPGDDRQLWKITDIQPGGIITLTSPDGKTTTTTADRLPKPPVLNPAVPQASVAPPSSTKITAEQLQQVLEMQAKQIGTGVTGAGKGLVDILTGPPLDVVQKAPHSIL